MHVECFKSPGTRINIKTDVQNLEKLENLSDLYNYTRITCSYRIKQAMSLKILRKNNVENENLIYKGLICAVNIHRKAMKLV